jgi:hypothetical protein
MRKLTTQDFIKKSIEKHGNKYDYSLVEYKNMKSKVKIIYNGWVFEQNAEDHLLGKLCELRWDNDRFIHESIKIHGVKYDYSKCFFKNMKCNVIIILDGIEYIQNPSKHLMGRCPEKGKKLRTNEEFIEDSRKIWGYKYDYSLVEYKGSFIKVAIKYNNNIYYQKPVEHLSGIKCEVNNIKNTEDFLRKAIERHGNKYDYSFTKYTGINNKVKILYNGILYEQKAGAHLYSSGLVENNIRRKTLEEFIIISTDIHDGKYSYDKSIYINNMTKLIITCPIHGDFLQRPSSHMKGFGCSSCVESKGEKAIAKFLDKNNISYYRQHKFDDCKNIFQLPFDFYIPRLRLCIEFDGKQHYEPMSLFGGIEAFEGLKINDNIKNEYCEDNYIDLVRIKYDQLDNIESYLKKVFKYKNNIYIKN